MRYLSFLKFGVFLPAGARIVHPDNISIGRSFAMGPFSQLICQDADKGSRIILGHHVGLNHHVFINADCGGKIIFGDNVIVGPMTIFRAADHNFDDLNTPIRFQGHKAGCIRVEDDVWIGAGVFVLPDVTIGKGSVVGAGSVVTKDIPPYSIAVGNPARVIRKRS